MDALEPKGPLVGVRVVEFAGLAPVTVAGMVLSDLGADVVRIDRLHHAADTDAKPASATNVGIDARPAEGGISAWCFRRDLGAATIQSARGSAS